MKGRLGLSICVVFVFVGALLSCNISEKPMDVGEDLVVELNAPGSPITLQEFVEFSDDFESGLDHGVWFCEALGGVEWTYANEGANGYAHSPAQLSYDRNNRMTDMLTLRDDFADFVLTWDMRFHTKSWHVDNRYTYFRSDNEPNVSGYIVWVGVEIPTANPQAFLAIRKIMPGTSEILALTPYAWELGLWYSFKLEAFGNVFRVKAWEKGTPEPTEWNLEANDPANTFQSGRIGFGDYWGSITDADNVNVTLPLQTVDVDIKPGSCPNPLNVKNVDANAKSKKGGVLPVAIVGTANLDVHDIDLSTVRLAGVAALRHEYDDVTTPIGNGGDCNCTTLGSDGYDDLTLKFDRMDTVSGLGALADGDVVQLTLTGRLLDGTLIEGSDCVLIRGQ